MKISLSVTLLICTALGRVIEHARNEKIMEKGVPVIKLDVHKNDDASNQSLSTLHVAEVKDADWVKFNVISSRSVVEPPIVEVTFGNGIKDSFDLKYFQMKNMDASMGCRYIGRLTNNPWSSVAVTGCLTQPGDKMEVTMLSNHSIYSMFTVDYNSNTEILKDQRSAEEHSWAKFDDRDDSEAWHKEGDEMINDAIEKAADNAKVNT